MIYYFYLVFINLLFKYFLFVVSFWFIFPLFNVRCWYRHQHTRSIHQWRYFGYVGGCAYTIVSPGPSITDGQWHSIAVTYNGAGTMSFYADHTLVARVTTLSNACGEPQSTPMVLTTSGDDNNYLGYCHDDHSINYQGDLRNITYYDYAVTPALLSTITE